MCGLFGIYSYGDLLKQSDISNVIASLGNESCERGTDATGIAYVIRNDIEIRKAPKPAYDFTFNLPKRTNIVMGHTRATTQGSEKQNQNNHPFRGCAGGSVFVLAHNGVIWGDDVLRKKHKLPYTNIETDSYVAVQLLEKSKALNAATIGNMVEQLEGSYCFSILNNKSLYLVKGDNPLAVMHFKTLKAYLYASTESILWRGIVNSRLFASFKKSLSKSPSDIDEITLKNGDILTIKANGQTAMNHFKVSEIFGMRYGWEHRFLQDDDFVEREYIEQLKDTAIFMGVDPDIVEAMLAEGFSLSEMEEFIYDCSR